MKISKFWLQTKFKLLSIWNFSLQNTVQHVMTSVPVFHAWIFSKKIISYSVSYKCNFYKQEFSLETDFSICTIVKKWFYIADDRKIWHGKLCF